MKPAQGLSGAWRLAIASAGSLCAIVAAREPVLAGIWADQDLAPQITVAETAAGDPGALAELTEILKLSRSVNVASEFDAGTLEATVKRLVPLRAHVYEQPAPNQIKQTPLTKEPRAFFADATKWATDVSSAEENATGKLLIRVCWINPDSGNLRGRQITRAAVAATWEHYSAVSFIGWNKCESLDKGISIRIADERPNSVHGRFSDVESPSMILNFQFSKVLSAECGTHKEDCIYSVAIHEFGHALGLLHEQDAPGTPPICLEKLPPGAVQTPLDYLKARLLTDWDQFSVMNYCFDLYSKRVQLSECDIAAVQSEYNKSPTNPYQPACKVKSVAVVIPK